MEQIPAIGDLFRSHHGKGRHLARVTDITRCEVSLVHVGPNGNDRGRFKLPLWFFCHQTCGWRLDDEATRPTVQ